MIQYSARFISNLASLTEPLRELLVDKAKLEWEAKQTEALSKLKESISSDTVMTNFDLTRSTEIWVHASPVGLEAILVQPENAGNKRVVSYASRSLTPIDQRYSQIEREILAIAWAVQRFHIYVFERSFTVLTHHKPLLPIFRKSRLQYVFTDGC